MKQTIINIVLLIVVILLLFKGCQIQKDRDNLLTQINTLKAGEKVFKTKILSDSSTLATQTQTILTQDEAIKMGLLKLEGDIRKVQSQVVETTELAYNNVGVPYIPDGYVDTLKWLKNYKNGDTSKATYDSIINNSVIVPKSFGIDTKWYSINGKVKKDGLLIDSMKIPNETSVTIGYKKYGFLNLKSQPLVEVKNTNPYLKVQKMSNVVVKENKSILKSKLFWMGIGIFGGIYLQSHF
jgi:hypothetical protein